MAFSLLLLIAHMLMVSQSAPAPHTPGICLLIDKAVPVSNMLLESGSGLCRRRIALLGAHCWLSCQLPLPVWWVSKRDPDFPPRKWSVAVCVLKAIDRRCIHFTEENRRLRCLRCEIQRDLWMRKTSCASLLHWKHPLWPFWPISLLQ